MMKGDVVRVRKAGTSDEWTIAQVGLISANGKSVLLELEGAVEAGDGLMVGGLPVTIDYERETVLGLDGTEYEIETRGERIANDDTDTRRSS